MRVSWGWKTCFCDNFTHDNPDMGFYFGSHSFMFFYFYMYKGWLRWLNFVGIWGIWLGSSTSWSENNSPFYFYFLPFIFPSLPNLLWLPEGMWNLMVGHYHPGLLHCDFLVLFGLAWIRSQFKFPVNIWLLCFWSNRFAKAWYIDW